ncbi:GlcG/HbpS family heme-binding protein [Ktedonobacter racemifer]|uniref:GlcG/HbpS family heme-binding protein n=1 Tax=Ktedonobacter racemifer TaxID=363277 RepID=UPI0009491847|nr:heme-binding protein [Ktedonobacter racemifer]
MASGAERTVSSAFVFCSFRLTIYVQHHTARCRIGSIDISIKKAFTARAFDITTKDLATQSQPGRQFFGIHASNDGRVMIFAGGVPLKRDGKVVGAVGVSGGSGEQDHAVAMAGAEAF